MATAFRPCGDFYTEQLPWECDVCAGSEYSCVCDGEDEAPRCLSCDEVLTGDYCDDCDELGLAPVVRISANRIAA